MDDRRLVTSEFPVNMVRYSGNAVEQLRSRIKCCDVIDKRQYGLMNTPVSFDTETSSFFTDQYEPCALVYVWMFGIDDYVVYGRHLDEFQELISKMETTLTEYGYKMFSFVHFLKYDFSFIKKYFGWDTVFSRANREPLYARTGNIEFRDSLVLSGGQSLARIGKNLRVPTLKAVGDLDYSLIRHNETPLTQRELHYCEYDIRVLNQYIREKIEDEGGIDKIPYTNTGYVRRYVRNECFKRRGRYMELMDRLTMTPDAYLQMERAFMGGSVGANIARIGKTIKNVHSYDIKSSYPYVMVTGYYPMSYGLPVKDKEANQRIEELVTSHCCQFTLEAWDVSPKYDFCCPISYHKLLDSAGVSKAGGRVNYAAYLKMNVTELDYDTYKKFYDFNGGTRISRMRIFTRGYLPEPIVRSVFKFFYDKTTLDGVKGKEKEYMISKNMLNSIYGMMVEKILRDIILYDEDFKKEKPNIVNEVVQYNEKRNRFLFYPWGVWVTAHARWRLFDAILNMGNDFVYCDTDCVKFVGNHQKYFDMVNKMARKSLMETGRRLHMKREELFPVSPSGSEKCLGVWEHEHDYDAFKTLGAKRYMTLENEKYSLTVSGTRPDTTLEYILRQSLVTSQSPFDIFKEGLVIPPEYSHRTVSKFFDDERCGWVKDYLGNKAWFSAPSGVYTEGAPYTFSITEEMIDAIEALVYDGHFQEGIYD